MRNKILLCCLLGAVFTGFMTNSCKKSNQNYIQTLLTTGEWQLASVQVTHFVGDTTKATDTLYTTCNYTQLFTFKADNSCTYTNFGCIQQTASGHWSLSANKLNLISDIVCQDTTTTSGSSTPFQNAQILNLGQYSLVLRTGDLESFYPPDKVRVITRYGFVRVKQQ